MNIHYPIHERANPSMLVLLAIAAILISLIAASHVALQPVAVNIGNAANASGSQARPHPLPVPEPPLSQPVLQSHVSSTPVPQGAQLHLAPQPIPVPQAGQ